jgi:GAF domain-containing protein
MGEGMADEAQQNRSLAAQRSPPLATLRAYDVANSDLGPEFKEIVRVAAESCDAPMAAIAFADGDRLHFFAKTGLEPKSRRLDPPEAEALLAGDLIVPDLRKNSRFEFISARWMLDAKAYAGIPLTAAEGLPLGTLCVFDTDVREFKASEVASLRLLA